MKFKALLVLVTFVTCLNINAQDYFPNKEKFNGKYYTMKPIKQPGNGTVVTQMICQVGDLGNKRVLTTANSPKGMPFVFSFKAEDSKQIKKYVFYSQWGIMALEYDKESFVLIGITGANPYVDFYSKNKATVAGMTEKKAMEYASQYEEIL